MIVVSGATGTIGSELSRLLKARNVPFRAFVRHPEKAAALKGPGVEVFKGDLSNPSSVETALKGADKLFLLSPSSPEAVTQHSNAIKAAKKAGVKHIVRLSVMGAANDSPVTIMRWHAQSDKELKESGISWTILQPTFFMQNTLQFAGTIKSNGAFYGCWRDGKAAMIDARDIAEAGAVTLTKDGHIGKTYPLTGPQPVSFLDVAATLTKVLGKPVKYVDLPPEQLKKNMIEMGLPEWYATDLVTMGQGMASGQASTVDPSLERILARPGRTYEVFARDHAKAFT